MSRFDLAKKVNIAYILESYGYRPNKEHKYSCPFHEENTPSVSIHNNKIKCFGCGVNASTIDLVMKLEGVDEIKAVNLILDKFTNEQRFKSVIEPLKEKSKERLLNTSYIRKNSNKVYEIDSNKYIKDYLEKRCIKDKVSALYNFGVTLRHNYYKGHNYIIYDFDSFMIQKAVDGSIKRNIGTSDIFMMEYDKSFDYYLVEGIEDAISLLEALNNINIICLNSVANKNKLFSLLDESDYLKEKRFIFALDFDKAGIDTGKEIKAYMTKNNIKYDYYMQFYHAAKGNNCIKDINDYIIYLQKNRAKEVYYD